ncbi:hypothetical protein LLG10_03580 [bacterium]|nr:hypothetical protein [bacterium]
MNEGYVLEWLDNLITVALNPGKANIDFIQADDVANIQRHIINEKNKIMITIKLFVFSVQNENNIRSGVKLYHSSLIDLLDQAVENQIHYVGHPELEQIFDELISCIDELILFIENRFSFYLGTYERLPAAYSSRNKNELMERISDISDYLNSYPGFQPASDILVHTLFNYLNLPTKKHSFTFQDIAYVRDLCCEIERIEPTSENEVFTALDEQLIYMNFNNQAYINNLTRRLADDINTYDRVIDRMEKLLFLLKSFQQLHRKPGVIFNPKLSDLHSTVNNWFKYEISYLEKKMRLSVKSVQITETLSKQGPLPEKNNHKVMCSLSSDQFALLIRAAAEVEILTAKSLNYLFKIIVPHLSTPHRSDLSHDGVRNKAYVAEQRDKDILISILERIIKKIKEY